MNRFVKDMLMSQSRRSGGRDERNPYGSRGGYVSSRRPRGRDRDMEDYGMPKGDYRRGGMPPMRDYDDYDMRGDMRGRDYADYEMQDMRGRDYADYGMDYGMRDYGEL